ncbi:MAG: chemotaxis protein CheC [Candidatus Hodarchaeota archaeon]
MLASTEYMKYLNVVEIVVDYSHYLIDSSMVKEIYIPGDKVIPVPLANRSIIGIIDIRGDVYTIISLRHRIHPVIEEKKFDGKSPILLLDYKGMNVALMVDSVSDIKKVPATIFENTELIIETEIDMKFVKSTGLLDDTKYLMLDLEAIMETPGYEIQREVIVRKKKKRKLAEASFKIQDIQPKSEKVKYKAKGPLILSEDQKDLLMELGNIGTGNAVVALSQMIKERVDVNLTDVNIISFQKFHQQFGGKSEKVCGIFAHIEQPSTSTIMQVFELNSMMNLVVKLAGNKTKIKPDKVQSKKDLDEFAISTIEELGNILAGNYISSIANMVDMKMVFDVPNFTLTNISALGEFLSTEMQSFSQYMILINTEIDVKGLKIKGNFFYIPDENTLRSLFSKLGIKSDFTAGPSVDIVEKSKPITKKELKKINLSSLKLTEMQRDALQEIGNIGCGHSATALAQMINQRVDINIPSVEMITVDKFAKNVTVKNEKLFVSWSNVTGRTNATVLVIFKAKDITYLTSILLEDDGKRKIDLKKIKSVIDFPEDYRSAMSETCHILASHYANALGNLLEMRLMTEPPDMCLDSAQQLFTILKDEIGLLDELSLVILTNIIVQEYKIESSFLFIPELDTLQDLLDALTKFFD